VQGTFLIIVSTGTANTQVRARLLIGKFNTPVQDTEDLQSQDRCEVRVLPFDPLNVEVMKAAVRPGSMDIYVGPVIFHPIHSARLWAGDSAMPCPTLKKTSSLQPRVPEPRILSKEPSTLSLERVTNNHNRVIRLRMSYSSSGGATASSETAGRSRSQSFLQRSRKGIRPRSQSRSPSVSPTRAERHRPPLRFRARDASPRSVAERFPLSAIQGIIWKPGNSDGDIQALLEANHPSVFDERDPILIVKKNLLAILNHVISLMEECPSRNTLAGILAEDSGRGHRAARAIRSLLSRVQLAREAFLRNEAPVPDHILGARNLNSDPQDAEICRRLDNIVGYYGGPDAADAEKMYTSVRAGQLDLSREHWRRWVVDNPRGPVYSLPSVKGLLNAHQGQQAGSEPTYHQHKPPETAASAPNSPGHRRDNPIVLEQDSPVIQQRQCDSPTIQERLLAQYQTISEMNYTMLALVEDNTNLSVENRRLRARHEAAEKKLQPAPSPEARAELLKLQNSVKGVGLHLMTLAAGESCLDPTMRIMIQHLHDKHVRPMYSRIKEITSKFAKSQTTE
jgi:hypothetical protein